MLFFAVKLQIDIKSQTKQFKIIIFPYYLCYVHMYLFLHQEISYFFYSVIRKFYYYFMVLLAAIKLYVQTKRLLNRNQILSFPILCLDLRNKRKALNRP